MGEDVDARLGGSRDTAQPWQTFAISDQLKTFMAVRWVGSQAIGQSDQVFRIDAFGHVAFPVNG
ncbi:MAG TPA: hypothetical protein DGG94_06960 [Micromonosporaceae bacterium]|nr:hypothetical protein [Micromonosporaceae bacterium]HCU49527.1 hypothetical protein [Micromonosporaceae bacterium]